MKFSVATVIAFAAAALAQPKLTNTEFTVEEGKPFTITWINAEGPVTLTLKNGPEKDLQDVTVIASDVSGTSFTWTPEGLPSDTYAIEINDASGVPNYSLQFSYQGTGTVSSASSSASASAKTSASSSVTSSASKSSTTSSDSSSTTSAPESSSTQSSSTTSSKTSTTARVTPTVTPTNNNEGQRFSSPLALLLVTVAAVVFFN